MTLTFRATLPAWILVGGLSTFPWFILWADSGRGVNWSSVIFPLIISGFSLVWLVSFKIAITENHLIFRSLFRGNRAIAYNDIRLVQLKWKFWTVGKGPLRLVVEPRDGTNMPILEINAKVFSRGAIDAVLDLGNKVARSDDNGLRHGIVAKTLQARKKRT